MEKITTTFSEKFQIKRLPGEVLKVLNLPVPTYDVASESAYSLTNVLHSIFGVDVFTLTFILALYFVASLALVSIVLPNIYFRLMLWADVTEDSASIYDDYDDEYYTTYELKETVKNLLLALHLCNLSQLHI